MAIYHLSNKRITVRDIENALAINLIILLTKELVYNAMKKGQSSNILSVKSDI